MIISLSKACINFFTPLFLYVNFSRISFWQRSSFIPGTNYEILYCWRTNLSKSSPATYSTSRHISKLIWSTYLQWYFYNMCLAHRWIKITILWIFLNCLIYKTMAIKLICSLIVNLTVQKLIRCLLKWHQFDLEIKYSKNVGFKSQSNIHF